MSELRERLNELIDNHGLVAGLPKDMLVAKLEAFANAERVKALEEVRPMMSRLWVAAGSNMDRHEEYMFWIDAEITKLKEGNSATS